jgi:hypothetical protein
MPGTLSLRERAHVAPFLASRSWIGHNRATEVNLLSPHDFEWATILLFILVRIGKVEVTIDPHNQARFRYLGTCQS